jgi:hypothetical protein
LWTGLGNWFLDTKLKTQAIKETINWTSSKLKTFVLQRISTKWKYYLEKGKTFANHVSDKGLIPRI